MCGRYAMPLENEQLLNQFNSMNIHLRDNNNGTIPDDSHINTPSYNILYKPSYNFSPTQLAPIYTNQHVISYNTWGLSTLEDSLSNFSTFNARKEKVQSQSSPLWNSVLQKRCVVPISGYFEWNTHSSQKGKRKTPYFITKKDPNDLMFLLGFYNQFSSQGKVSMGSFTILTRPSEGSKLEWLHSRIPMIIRPLSKEWNDWLDPDLKFDNKLLNFQNYEKGIYCYEVGDLVGNTRNDGETLIREVKQRRGIDDWFKKKSIKEQFDEKNSTIKNERDFKIKKITHKKKPSMRCSITDLLINRNK